MTENNNNEPLQKYINEFFEELEIYDDKYNNHNYKNYLSLAITNFLENENEYNAAEIYRLFFEIYQITGEDKSESKNSSFTHNEPNILLDLVETLKEYEKSTGELIEKQRDHYIHSVNVFILGLAVFSQNENYRDAFLEANHDGYYQYFYETKNEEFFYRWGIASLFHDIGYPLEIIGKQMKKFIKDGVNIMPYDVKTHLSFEDFEKFNTIAKINPNFPKEYRNAFDEANFIDLFKPLDILAHKIHLAFEDIELESVKNNLDNFINVMATNGFIDHGFYSAILVIIYYGYLIQKYNKKPEFFFFPVVDSGSAILLHNYYRNVLMNKEFNRGKLEVREHPIAYLLILCDELQEWNRKPFGIEDKKKSHANESKITITNRYMDVEYIIKNGALSPDFGREKSEFLNNVLDIHDLFNRGLAVNTITEDIVEKLMIEAHKIDIQTPKQVIKNIEELAKITHDYYNKLRIKQKKPIEYPNFDDLPNHMKYSNFRQARAIPNKLSLIGCEIVPISDKREEVTEFPEYEVEFLAELEHDEWNKERISTGWKCGYKINPETGEKEKDVDNKLSPFIVPWEELDEEIKDFDRDPIENIPNIMNEIGMKVVRTNLRLVAIKIHDFFINTLKEEGNSSYTENFDDLPVDIQYSNFKQSESIPDLLNAIGYKLVSKNDEGVAITKFSNEELDSIAEKQHQTWFNDRIAKGWKPGKEKDDKKKINPNLKPWKKLNKNMKKINMKTISQLPQFLADIDMKIVKK